jgi:hypothetical protein
VHIAGSGSVIITDAEISKLPNKNKILKIIERIINESLDI